MAMPCHLYTLGNVWSGALRREHSQLRQASPSWCGRAVHAILYGGGSIPALGLAVGALEVLVAKVVLFISQCIARVSGQRAVPAVPPQEEQSAAPISSSRSAPAMPSRAEHPAAPDGAAKAQRNAEVERLLRERTADRMNVCPCPQVNHRLRQMLEDATLEKMEQQFPSKNQPITLVSVGPGECLQELIYLVKLKKAGYTRIRLVLIDPEFVRIDLLNAPAALEALRAYAADHLRPDMEELTIHPFPSLAEYRTAASQNADLKPHLLCLIDLQGHQYGPNRPRWEENLLSASHTFFRTHALFPAKAVVSFTKQGLVFYSTNCFVQGPNSRISDAGNLVNVSPDSQAIGDLKE